MHKTGKSLSEVLEKIKEKRFVRPNEGFMKQLELFEAMKCQFENNNQTYKSYMLQKVAEKIQMGADPREAYASELRNSIFASNNIESNLSCFKCKKCR